ncbi:MAG: hypothetical protein AB3N17_01465, partial [Tateyamaria sp.]
PEALDALLQAEGFAGSIVFAQAHCTWRREINWHGVPQAEDVGFMSFDGDTLYEDGVLAEYREKWSPEPTAPNRGSRIKSGAMAGVLIDTDELFLFGIGAEPTHHVDPSLGDRLAVAAHFASTYCLGRWTGDQGIALLSTNPFCEGQVVLTRAETWVWHAMSFDGVTDPQPLTLH